MEFERGQLYVFNYLWHHEAKDGEESGRKPRRCVVIPLIDRAQLLVLAISSSADGNAGRVAMPELEAKRLGLSTDSAVVVGELNLVDDDNLVDFISLTPVGKLSAPFAKTVARAVAERWQEGSLVRVERS